MALTEKQKELSDKLTNLQRITVLGGMTNKQMNGFAGLVVCAFLFLEGVGLWR